jgi:hypothetical protein
MGLVSEVVIAPNHHSATWGQMGARKNDKVPIKKREISGNFSSLSEGIYNAVNSLEKMIYKWGQMSNYDNLSPLVFGV